MKALLLAITLNISQVSGFVPVGKFHRGCAPSSGYKPALFSRNLRVAASSADDDSPALCLEGGGFLAVAVHTGLTTGLLRTAKLYGKSNSYDLDKSRLFGRIKNVVSNSGGSWFSSQLMYSNFTTLVQDMAQEEQGAGAASLFKKKWTEPWIELLSKEVSPRLEKRLTEFLKLLFSGFSGKIGYVEDAKMLFYFWDNKKEGGLTWFDFVHTLLTTTSDMQNDLTLGSPVNSWCKGKNWVLNTATVTPTNKKNGYYVWSGGLRAKERVQYWTGSSNPVQPSRFSVVLGASSSTPSPLSVAAPGVLANEVVSYSGSNWWNLWNQYTAESSPGMLPLTGPSQSALSLSAAVACSSAFLGSVPLNPIGADVEKDIHSVLSMWIAGAEPNTATAFKKGRQLVRHLIKTKKVTQDDINDMAKSKLYGIVDGGFCDNTGIINAVAAGSKELYVFLDESSKKNTEFDDDNGLLNLFTGGNTKGKHSQCFFPIFATTKNEAETKVNNFKTLDIPATATELTEVRVGTIESKTIDNPTVGISKDIDVTLHIIMAAAPVSIGYAESFNNYATIVGDLSDTFQLDSNSDIVKNILGSLMDGDNTFPTLD